jgi:hypothetical protein
MSTGSARAVSIIRPKAFFASRADMVFMAESRSDQCGHLGRNGSFWQALLLAVSNGLENGFWRRLSKLKMTAR